MGFNWTAEAIGILRAKAAAAVPASQIAAIFGITRNAVIGKSHREKIKLECTDTRSGGYARQRSNLTGFSFRKSTSRPAAIPKLVIRDADEPLSRNLSVIDLQKNDCRFIVTDDHPMLYCGAPKADGSSYCAHHHVRCHQ